MCVDATKTAQWIIGETRRRGKRENQQCKKRFPAGEKIVVVFELSFVKGERNFNNICDKENS